MPTLAATLTSKGQLTVPAELRRLWRLEAGDTVEFFRDHKNEWHVRPLNAGPTEFFDSFKARPRVRGVASDDEAIARLVKSRNRSPARRAAE